MTLIVQGLGILLLVLLAAGITIRLLYPLPDLGPRPVSRYLEDTARTPLGQGATKLISRQDVPAGYSGVHMLKDGRDAFAARILLARSATRTLDVQYYIWHGDLSGTLLLEAMRDAAERGVRVRLLLDDNGIAGLDDVLAALDRHPNIEIRLFNPFVLRKPKMLGYLADFARLNRRMHNKSFTADNQATIIGGRNVGDEYFGARDDGLFADLDVLAIGPVVGDVSRDFDRYWSSRSAYPAERILPPASQRERESLRAAAARIGQDRDPTAGLTRTACKIRDGGLAPIATRSHQVAAVLLFGASTDRRARREEGNVEVRATGARSIGIVPVASGVTGRLRARHHRQRESGRRCRAGRMAALRAGARFRDAQGAAPLSLPHRPQPRH